MMVLDYSDMTKCLKYTLQLICERTLPAENNIIGINAFLSFGKTMTIIGIKLISPISKPFNQDAISQSTNGIIIPRTTQCKNAEILACLSNFCIIIGTTSIIPATIPINNAIKILFMIFPLLFIENITNFLFLLIYAVAI